MAMIRKAETHGHTWVEESETSLGISTELHNANTGNCTCTKTGLRLDHLSEKSVTKP